LLAPGSDENRFDQSKAARITGIVVNVKAGGVTSANFKRKELSQRDTNIQMALVQDAPAIQRVYAVVTPSLRKYMKEAQGVDWTTEALRDPNSGIVGKRVQITGWLFFKRTHVAQAENTNSGNPRNYRATCWEIHPVTDIRILDETSPK